MSNTDLAELDGERGLPSVNARRPGTGKNLAIFTLLVIALLSVVGGLFFFSSARAQGDQKEQKEMTPARSPVQKTFTFPDRPARRPVTDDDLGVPPPAAGGTGGMERPPVATDQQASVVGIVDKSGANLMSKEGQSNTMTTARTYSEQEPGGSGALDGMLTSSRTPAARATKMPDRNFLLAKGSSIRCNERSKVVSTIAGMTVCTVAENIYSDNGNVLLIPRGSRIPAEFRADVQRGSQRIHILYTHIDTPDGIRINLNSPGADALGGSGVPGYVDDHFWQRFRGAILLTIVGDSMAALVNAARPRNGQNITMSGTGNSASDVATEALKNSINIPPTLYINQGEQIVVYVARDLDFSSVYELTTDE